MPAAAANGLRSRLRHHCCFSSLQLAQKHMQKARQLLVSQKRDDADAALVFVEAALELCPSLEKALELRARTLLWLRRYKDVVEMLHDYVPSFAHPPASPQVPLSPPSPVVMPESPAPKESTRLLMGQDPNKDELLLLSPIGQRFSMAKLRHRLSTRPSHKKTGKQQEWRYLVLGQACFYLGMLEDAMVLLQNGKRTASAVLRLRCNSQREDNFSLDVELGSNHHNEGSFGAASGNADVFVQMLSNIKFLLRRRTAAMAALEVGLYSESVRHFSKIIDGRKGLPSAFIADCYLQRAIAYQATGRVVDAIADCNRTLALNPNCAKALSIRASLYETVRCYSEFLLDLQQLKMIYDASLRYQMLPEPCMWKVRHQLPADVDLAGGLDYINSKITAARKRLGGVCPLDAHTILDMPRSCTMDDVKRAYLVLSLKHRPDTATHFIDRCELADDERDMATLREEMQASAQRLSQLIHKAYTKVLSCIAEEKDIEKQGGPRKPEKSKGCTDGTPLIDMGGSGQGECDVGRERIFTEGWDNGEDTSVDNARHDEGGSNSSSHSSTSSSSSGIHDEGRGAEDDMDACDFCQPFGGLTSAALADVLSHALLHDAPISTTLGALTVTPWMSDWNLALSHQPLKVT